VLKRRNTSSTLRKRRKLYHHQFLELL